MHVTETPQEASLLVPELHTEGEGAMTSTSAAKPEIYVCIYVYIYRLDIKLNARHLLIIRARIIEISFVRIYAAKPARFVRM